jgi:hypothetical protein
MVHRQSVGFRVKSRLKKNKCRIDFFLQLNLIAFPLTSLVLFTKVFTASMLCQTLNSGGAGSVEFNLGEHSVSEKGN